MDIISSSLIPLGSVSGRKMDITDLELFFGSAVLSEQSPQSSVTTRHWASERKRKKRKYEQGY